MEVDRREKGKVGPSLSAASHKAYSTMSMPSGIQELMGAEQRATAIVKEARDGE